jgi:tripartite motif-containing protein 71
VADQLSYVVQKFTAAGAFETEWGSYGGGHGQFGPIGGLATDAAATSTWSTPATTASRSSTRTATSSPPGGTGTGSEVGQFNFGSSQDYTQPPGGGIAVAGNYVYVADSGNNRVERFNLSGGEAHGLGHAGRPARAVLLSPRRRRQRGRGARQRRRQPPHRALRPDGAFQEAVGTHGSGPGQFGFPYGVALDGGRRRVRRRRHQPPRRQAQRRSSPSSANGAASAPNRGSWPFPRALASDPAGDTYVADTANDRVEVYDTNSATTCARSGSQPAAPAS